jgi:hypothetical protein
VLVNNNTHNKHVKITLSIVFFEIIIAQILY